MNIEDNDKTDTENEDRGDELTPPERDEQPRDEKGRYATSDAAPSGTEQGEGEEEEEEEEEDILDGEDESNEGAEDSAEHSKNYAIRYNKARDKLKKAEARIAELEASSTRSPQQVAPAPAAKDPILEIENDLDALYEQAEEARADGDTKTAAALQRQIDKGNAKIAEIKAYRVAQQTAVYNSEAAKFDALLDVAEAMVPALDPKSDDYDQGKVEALEAMVSGFERRGRPSSEALATAVSALFGVDLVKKTAPKQEKNPPPSKKPDARKATDTMQRQPPAADTRGVTKDDARLRIADLSDEEFDKLPESTKARYRGDVLTS